MSEVFKIIGVGLITALLALLVKQNRPELAIGISIAGGLVIVFMVISPIKVMIDTFSELCSKTGIDAVYIELILKVICISYLIQFSSEIAKDAGELGIASTMELAGKVCIFVISAPVILSLMDMIISLIH